MYTSQLKQGNEYYKLQKTIGIFILDYELFSDKNDFKTTYKMTNIKDLSDSLDELELHFIELPKFERARPEITDKLIQWMYFLSNIDEEAVQMAIRGNTAIKEANEKISKMEKDEAIKYMAFLKMKGEHDYNTNMHGAREEGIRVGKEEGIRIGEERGKRAGRTEGIRIGEERGKRAGRTEGIRIGEECGKLSIAKKLLKNGMKISEIAKITELPEKEIRKLK